MATHEAVSTSSKSLPRGSAFLSTVATVERHCGEQTLEQSPELGVSTPACVECLGTVLSMLYEEACCFHGCLGGDHLNERLTARIVTNALSSLRLANLGYYDESLALTRNLGELANLLFLFAAEPPLVAAWRAADDKQRKRDFSPVRVRLKLEEKGLRPPVDESRYSLLCEVGVHVHPSVSPQSYNDHGRATLGAQFQVEGYMCTLNELCIAVAEAAACVSTFPGHPERRMSLRAAAEVLLNAVGALDLQASKRG